MGGQNCFYWKRVITEVILGNLFPTFLCHELSIFLYIIEMVITMNTDVKERKGTTLSVGYRQSISSYNPTSACLYVKAVG